MQAASASRQKQRRLCFSNSQGALALTSHILVAKRKENEKRLTVGYHILIQNFPFCMQVQGLITSLETRRCCGKYFKLINIYGKWQNIQLQ